MNYESGMYVRTNSGYIYKLSYYDEETRRWICVEEYGWYPVYESQIKKANEDIISLLEEGDYVNGVMVESMNNSIKPTPIPQYKNECGEYVDFDESEIKTVVTKEAFEGISYKVSE